MFQGREHKLVVSAGFQISQERGFKMDSEEKNLITQFFARVGGGQGVTKSLPPIDPEANQLIAQELRRYPDAPYRITQLAVVQEEALVRANQRIQQLQAQLQQASTQRGGFFSNLFGGGQRSQQVPPRRPMGSVPPVGSPYAGYAPRSGSGFLGSALTTAAGVAGGMLAADALENMFSGHHGAEGMSGADSFGTGAVDDPSDPFSGSGAEVQGYDDSDFGGGFDDGGFGGDDFGGDFGDDSMF